jgi:hypothetical protein
LQHIQQNIRSTKDKTAHMFAMICDVRQEIHTDLTGAFPVVSSRGNRYVFILFDYDSNAILATPIKNRKKETILEAYKKRLNELISRGLKPKLQRMDNEASQLLKDYITHDEKIDLQLVPPHMH